MLKYLKRILNYSLSVFVAISAMVISPSSLLAASSITLTSSGAWFESAFAEWEQYNGASSYNVYYKSASNDYTKVDSELIRGTRVDIPGLKGDTNYTIKVVPVVSGSEVTSATTQFSVTPAAYDRSGYAFFNGTTTGGYNEDGTVKENANIVYVTDATKDSVQLNGYTGIANILSESARKNDKTPLIVRFIGTINVPKGATSYPDNMVTVKAAENVTLEGIGPDANISKWGFRFQRSSNIEVRNLDFYWYPEDAMGFESNCSRVWVHNNTIRTGHQDNPSEADKAHGDGGTDFKYTDYVTVSYNHYDSCAKTSLCGLKENATYRLTFHHNFFDGTGSRTPRVRYFDIHVYNNYYKGVSTYGIGASVNSNIFSENNYFEDTEKPMVISMQGNGGTIFSSENGGTIKAYGNKLVNCTKYTPGTDYYEATSRDQVIQFSANKGGSTYNNFDTNSSKFYTNDYVLHSADTAKEMVIKYAGRMNGSVSDSVIDPGTGDNGGGTDNGGTDNGGTDNGGTDNGDTDNGDTDNGGNNPSDSSDCVALGTYELNKSTVPATECTVNNITFNVRSVESTGVKLRSNNTITFKVADSCTLKVEASGKGIIVSSNDGQINYNGSTSNSVTADPGSITLSLTAGTYTITGAETGSNTLITSLTFN